MAKALRQFKNLSRVPAANYARSAFAKTGRYNPLAIFESESLLHWLKGTWRFAFDDRVPFPPASAAPNGTSVYKVPNNLWLAIAGDWGTGSDEAELIANQMRQCGNGGMPDLTIHLGDVYYVGDPVELEQNCLGGIGQRERAPQDCVTWHHGRLGSFALQGNHEMYADGKAYFQQFLPTLGMLGLKNVAAGQGASFFCLENDTWRVLGIDTGYNSVTHTPIVRLFEHGDGHLERALIDWLQTIVQPQQSPKATVLLSHHQYFSGFEEEEYPLPAQQLQPFLNSPFIWFWGHEHRFAGYKLFGTNLLKVHGRCIGHGGMPVQSSPLLNNAAASQLLFYDKRVNPLYSQDKLGYNGFAKLEFAENTLTVRYLSLAVAEAGSGKLYKDEPALVRTETFEWDGTNFAITKVHNYQIDKGFTVLA